MLNYKYKLIDIYINRYEFQVVDNYNKGTKNKNHSKAMVFVFGMKWKLSRNSGLKAILIKSVRCIKIVCIT